VGSDELVSGRWPDSGFGPETVPREHTNSIALLLLLLLLLL
jgi:hypothetical protein